MTDVGARCPTCAPSRKLPQFEVGPVYLLRGAAAALASGAVLGGLWWLILADSLGFFSLIVAILLGYAVAESVSWATNHKSGPALQVAASAGIVVAYVARNLLLGWAPIPTNDLYGYVVVVLGIVVAANRLRF
ncbi:MAG: hypothetical protein HYY03_04945 [Chloroflexi bacterium]|nr:hypothetical protein [Chloroflexota bacterium]